MEGTQALTPVSLQGPSITDPEFPGALGGPLMLHSSCLHVRSFASFWASDQPNCVLFPIFILFLTLFLLGVRHDGQGAQAAPSLPCHCPLREDLQRGRSDAHATPFSTVQGSAAGFTGRRSGGHRLQDPCLQQSQRSPGAAAYLS